jgi:WhiB family redox-sensing transcriptional regulator
VSDIGDLLDLVRARPAFHADAACREAPPEVTWFPERGQSSGPAKAVCRRCLVLWECRTWALAQDGLEGIWGGLSKAERSAGRRGIAA